LPSASGRGSLFAATRSPTAFDFMAITYKTPDDIAALRIAGRLAADVLAMIGEHVQAGVSTDELDALCNDYIVNTQKAIPANVGYLGFPKTVCTSVNQVVCHGIPSRAEILKDGDIVNIDVAVIKNGYFGDTSRMYCVGKPSTVARQLIDTTYEATLAGIREVKPGATLGDVGHAIQKVAQRDGFSIVRDYCGHGIGKVYHEDPQVLHYGQPGQGVRLKPGMVFTIEPMINAGRAGTTVLRDGWTVVTKDRSLSAQWEHMVTVTEDGFELLTPWPDGTGSYEAP
jgi:methionyl aminopeptidase